ncbi:uncharacterized protein LOC108210479 isoform X2 [Daucus carota subsp. sativus]|uniref:uncharacterized protein LOC108210479 isoform X2 n=1 Tax=Daucus carota subsp. sativus TaxID=79200 RepID=UPI00308358C8
MDEAVHINKFHWMDLCIKCDKGGKLLTCHQNGCPVVVHEDCLGSEAQFDDIGNFYCPYCVYKQATEDFTRAQREVVLAEKVLSKYLDGEGLGTEAFGTVNVTKSSDVGNWRVELEKDCHQMTGRGCIIGDHEADVNKESDVLLNRFGDDGRISDDINRVKSLEKQNELEGGVSRCGDECCSGGGQVDQQNMDRRCQSGDKIQYDAILTDTPSKQHQDAGHLEAHKIMKESVEAVEESEETMDEIQNQEQAHKSGRCQSGDKIQYDAILTDTPSKQHQDAGHFESHKIMKESVEAVEESEETMYEIPNQEQAHKTTEKIMCKESAPQVHTEAKRKVGDTTASTCMDNNTISEKVIGAQPPGVNAPSRSLRKNKSVHIEKGSTRCKPSKVATPPTIFTKLPALKEKRKRLAWKVEEEEMLKDTRHFEAHKIMKESVEAVEESEETMDEIQNQEQAHKTTEKIMCKESAPQVHTEAKRKVGDTTASTCMDANTISEKLNEAETPGVNTPRRSPRNKKSVHIEKGSTPCKPSKVAKPPTIFTKLPTHKEKRKRLAWKVEEEEMLKGSYMWTTDES